MKLLALDLGAHIGWAACRDAERPVWGRVRLGAGALESRNPDGLVMLELHRLLTHLIGEHRPDWIAAEKPWVPRPRVKFRRVTSPLPLQLGAKLDDGSAPSFVDPQTVRRLSMFFGLAAMLAAKHELGWLDPDTLAVTRHFLGSASYKSAEKKRLTKARCELLGWRSVTLDEADSLALLEWMRAKLLRVSVARPAPLLEGSHAR